MKRRKDHSEEVMKLKRLGQESEKTFDFKVMAPINSAPC